ncbi:MAG: aldo/keto reductase [Acidobacteria bacterium]|nr:aldo/keto reductase [Acidobacteriota bacterium]
MLYRKMGKTTVDVSILGFGAMRLPMVGAKGEMDSFDPKIPIDEEEATRIVEYNVEHGVNYFDTAYVYHAGKSETFLGKALQKYRSKVHIATKLPTWNVEKREDLDRFFNEQLEKLRTDYIDFYLIHGIGKSTWEKMKGLGVLEFLDKLRADGRIRYPGFSFHDDLKVFKEIVDAYDWGMCMVQHNYYDQVYQAGTEGVAYAASKGLGVVVMEPMRGGKLVGKIPTGVQALWDSAETKRSPVEWALRWVWNNGDVATVLSGTSALAQTIENVKLAENGLPDSLSPEELALIDKVRMEYRKKLKVDCTGCGYCMPCPSDVNIPQNFSMYNDTYMFDNTLDISRVLYNEMFPPNQRASACTECLECEELCPQKIEISKHLKDVHKRLGKEEKQ